MKVRDLFCVEGEPMRGGCHVKKMSEILDLNKDAFVKKRCRTMVILSIQPTLEQALDAEGVLKRERKNESTGENLLDLG